jgi:hypothetical protein
MEEGERASVKGRVLGLVKTLAFPYHDQARSSGRESVSDSPNGGYASGSPSGYAVSPPGYATGSPNHMPGVFGAQVHGGIAWIIHRMGMQASGMFSRARPRLCRIRIPRVGGTVTCWGHMMVGGDTEMVDTTNNDSHDKHDSNDLFRCTTPTANDTTSKSVPRIRIEQQ